MNLKNIAKTVAGFAPLLGGALGGPAGSKLGGMVASVLGVDNTPDAIESAIKNDPEAVIKLRQLESDESVNLRRIAFRETEAALKDRQDARQNHKDSRMPAILTVMLTVMMAAIVYALFTVALTDSANNILYLLLGSIATAWANAMGYWFGTSKGSADKAKQLGALER